MYDAIMADELEETDEPDGTYFRVRGVDIVQDGGKIVHSGLEEKGFLTTTARRPLSVRLGDHAKTILGIPKHLPQLD